MNDPAFQSPAFLAPPDDFQRETLARNFLRLARSGIPSLSPILLSGTWGTGKTVFCRLIERLVGEEKAAEPPLDCIYIDAFKVDHSEDPLLMILSFLHRHAAHAPRRTREAFADACLPYAGILAKTLGKAALDLLVPAAGNALLETAKSAAERVGATALERALEQCARTDERILALQKVLAQMTKKRTLLIMIDELDRCRPDFAVDLLEKIKHVFSLPRIVFLLVANSAQLCTSVAHRYGLPPEDAGRYLDKFIHYTFSLNATCTQWKHDSADASVIHFHDEVHALPYHSVFHADGSLFCMLEYLNVKSLSLREVESLVRYLSVLEFMTEEATLQALRTHTVLRDLAVLATCIFCFHAPLAHDIARGNYSVERVVALLDTSVMERDELLESMLHLFSHCAGAQKKDGMFYDPACRPALEWLNEQKASSTLLSYPEILWHRFFLGHFRTLNLHAPARGEAEPHSLGGTLDMPPGEGIQSGR